MLLRRDAFPSLGQKIDRLKPDGQRQFARFEDGAGGDRGLSMKAVAPAQFAGVEVAASVMAAVRTDETGRPAQSEQRFQAFLLIAILFREGDEDEAFVELDSVSFHGIYSFLSSIYIGFIILLNALIISGD